MALHRIFRETAAARRNDHALLARCYVASALLHGLIGICHHLHV